jgi:hypothetical protein
MVVILVELPNRPYQSEFRPSSTAKVPKVASQRSKDELASTLVEPPAEPDIAVPFVPEDTQPDNKIMLAITGSCNFIFFIIIS